MEEKLYLAWLHSIWLSQKKLHAIFSTSSNYKNFYEKLSFSILKSYKFTDIQIQLILERKQKISLEKIDETLTKRWARIITYSDKEYPELLKEIPNKPYIFYLRWEIDNTPKISIVWTRKITQYGMKVIESITPWLSKYFTVVSWWAAGCDTEAHKSCLWVKHKTISVIWTWIDIDYPTWNKALYNNIASSWGWVISIFPVWEVWNPYNFPVRNEVVAGLSVWTLVIEAQKKSWTLITANLSLDLWKDLFVIPGDIFKTNSDWCNNLIKSWAAKLVTWVADILEEYNFWIPEEKNKNINIQVSDKTEKKIYDLLLLESLSVDEIAQKILLEVSIITFKLSMMEVQWFIKKWFWWKYEIYS